MIASPQWENGHVKIANELMEQICKIRIPGEARQVFDAIILKTYGWNKKEDWIALKQFVELTGLSRQNANRAIKKLISMNLIVVKKDYEDRSFYSINKNYLSWNMKKSVVKKDYVVKSDSDVVKNDSPCSQKRLRSVVKSDTHKSNYTKDNIQKHENTHARTISNFENINSYEELEEIPTSNAFIHHRKLEGKKIVKEIFDSWRSDRRGNYFEVLETFMLMIDWNKEGETKVFYDAAVNYSSSNDVQDGIIMSLKNFIKQWRNWIDAEIQPDETRTGNQNG